MLSWFVLSTGLSMYNKWLMGKDYYNFSYPLFMTSIHFLVQFLLSELLLRLMCHQLRKDAKVLTWANYFKMVCTRARRSAAFTQLLRLPPQVVPTGAAGALDIGFSNYSLMFITLSFYTMCKSTAPIFLLGFSFLFGIEQITAKIVGLIAFITVGLLLTVYGETHFDIRGFVLVMIAAVLAGVRWSLTQILLQREELGLRHPLSTMNKTMPVMFICLFVVAIPMERLWELTSSPHFSSFGAAMATISLMLCGALMAFGMILSEFQFIHSTSAITFVVAGISKELVTIVCAVLFFGDVFGPINIAGLFIVVMGIVLFNFYKLYYLQRCV